MRVSNLYFCSNHTDLCPDLCVNVNQIKNESGLISLDYFGGHYEQRHVLQIIILESTDASFLGNGQPGGVW